MAAMSASKAGKIRVLIADDHKVVREGTRELLQKEHDLEVVGEAGDGAEAVELVKQLEPDVVIMDIAMPGLNGIEATKQIKELYPRIAVLILTAYEYDQYVFALLEAGAAGYLLKDVSVENLIEAIRAVYAGESVLHPAITRKVINRFSRFDEKAGTRNGLEQITEREIEVLGLAARGMSNRDIAAELSISVRTVQTHLSNIFNKMGVGSRTEAVMYGLRTGLITLEDTL